MKYLKTLAALGAAAMAAMPSNALVLTSIEIKSGISNWIQVAELQAFTSGAVNAALAANGGVATGSSTYSGFSTPDKANDGNTGGNYFSDTIFHSGGTGAGEYLRIGLSGPTDIVLVRIYGRTDCCSDRDLFTYTLFNGDTAVGTGTLDTRANHVAEITLAPGDPGAVPEPASWAMMIAGFGIVGGALRSRRVARIAHA